MKAADHRSHSQVAQALANTSRHIESTDPEQAARLRRQAAILRAAARGITDPDELRAISRATR